MIVFRSMGSLLLERPPRRNNLVTAAEQRLNINITIARSGARFAVSLCALPIRGVTFDGLPRVPCNATFVTPSSRHGGDGAGAS